MRLNDRGINVQGDSLAPPQSPRQQMPVDLHHRPAGVLAHPQRVQPVAQGMGRRQPRQADHPHQRSLAAQQAHILQAASAVMQHQHEGADHGAGGIGAPAPGPGQEPVDDRGQSRSADLLGSQQQSGARGERIFGFRCAVVYNIHSLV